MVLLRFDGDINAWLKSSRIEPLAASLMCENPSQTDETDRLYDWSSVQDGLFILCRACIWTVTLMTLSWINVGRVYGSRDSRPAGLRPLTRLIWINHYHLRSTSPVTRRKCTIHVEHPVINMKKLICSE